MSNTTTSHLLEDDIELRPEERTPCEVWTRVMGYHRPVAFFNKGKQQEHRDRRYFREARIASEWNEAV